MPATVTPKPRRIGLSKRDQPIWGHQLQTLPCVRPATPENVAAPPQGSSEEELVIEASGDESSEFDYTRPTKRRRQNNDEVGTMTRKSTSSPAVDESATGALACEPSNIAPSSFTRQSENSDEDELFKSSRTKRGKTYVRAINNIHTSRPNGQGKETKKDLRSTRIRKGSGFIKSDTGRLLSQVDKYEGKEKNSFKQPPISMNSLQSQGPTRRSPRSVRASAAAETSKSSKALSRSSAEVSTPRKTSKAFLQPSAIFGSEDSAETATVSKSFRKPFESAGFPELGTGDMQDLIAQTAVSRNLQGKRPSDLSTAESSIRSGIDDSGDSSPLSTPPSSPGIPVCPVCEVPVDREFLEEFNSGKRLKSRQQLRFCKAHKARSAKSEWAARGYPEIEWSKFDQRLRTYHPIIDAIVKGKRPSFYRNATEDRMNQSKFTTIKQMYGDNASVEEFSPGYYGSRGARAMCVFFYFPFLAFLLFEFAFLLVPSLQVAGALTFSSSENLTSSFASKLRRLAASDKIIQTSGVAAYVQAVLAPELAVLLVMDDMKTDGGNARAILRDSTDIGNLLNEEEDEKIDFVEIDDDS